MILKKFWEWYERNYKLNTGLAAGLFLLQIFHLFWLFGEVVTAKLFGAPLFSLHGLPKAVIILIDYTEIPALLSTSLIYINELRKKFNWKSLLYLLFLNSQWLHLFWITDEFVLEALIHNEKILLPLWLAWVAILIDFLELPVIYDTIKKFLKSYFSPPEDSITASSIGNSDIEA